MFADYCDVKYAIGTGNGLDALMLILKAAFLLVKLPCLDEVNMERRRIANRYLKEISNSEIVLPYVIDNVQPVWHIFGI